MARNRMIKPEIWTSEQFVNCSPTARLLFIGMWNFADDHGIIPAGTLHIKMCVLPGDPFTLDEIRGFINEIESQNLIIRFIAEDKEYLYITGWHHQKIDKPHYKYPNYDPNNSTTIRRPFDDHSTQEVKGKEIEVKGKEEEEMPENIPAPQITKPIYEIKKYGSDNRYPEKLTEIKLPKEAKIIDAANGIIEIPEKKEEEKPPPKEEENINKLAYPICMGIYNEFCKEHAGVGAKIDGAEGNALKAIIVYLKKEVKKQPPTTIDITQAFEWVLSNFNKWETFHQNKIKLVEINQNLVNIIKHITNGSGTNKQGATVNEALRTAAEQINARG